MIRALKKHASTERLNIKTKRVIGMFSYYSQFIKNFSEKIEPLVKADTYPINSDAENAFYLLKKDTEVFVVTSIAETVPFVVETDTSDMH